MTLHDRVAVLTGAGGGIGRALALSLARRGCHLALTDTNERALNMTAQMAGELGVRTSQHLLDVASRASVAAFPGEVVPVHGRVDLLINNAGAVVGGGCHPVRVVDLEWLMAVDLECAVTVTRAFLPLLRTRKQASVVNISSLFGFIAPSGEFACSASNFVVREYFTSWRRGPADPPLKVPVNQPDGIAPSIARNARGAPAVLQEIVQRICADMEKLLDMPPQIAAEFVMRGVGAERGRMLVDLDAILASCLERIMPVSYWRLPENSNPRQRDEQ
ncbi:SDR family NAD(P)-dependent oxidoreductase [Paraburkholderia ferrariae]|uniref:SDR family oxidoreductase n=1 Tax=Paraburkholderia ferrariae TaxID=386056 RepID=A0ABU9RMB4_9BURK